jgi:predicted amidohydrolase YtcJ
MAADLIALSGNPFELAREAIRECRVELTMVAGQVHHQLW